MKELFTALTLAQAEMEAASKDCNNPFFKSKYADLNAVMGAVKPVYAKHGLGFVQISHHVENCACVETMIVHESGQSLPCGKVSVPVSKSDAQGYGSALTYARRYSLAAAAGVGAEDDDGNAAAKAAPKIVPDAAGKKALEACGSLAALQTAWMALTNEQRVTLGKVKDEMKATITQADKLAA